MGNPQGVAGGRPVVVTIRLSEQEARDLDRRRRGLSRGAFIRSKLFGVQPR